LNLIPVFGLASAVFWLGDSLTAARILGAILIGLSVTIFTATELAEARSAAKADLTPSTTPQESSTNNSIIMVARPARRDESVSRRS
jgi:hypothetical protein